MNIAVFLPPKRTVMLDDSYGLTQVLFPERIQEIGALRIRAWADEPGIDPLFFSKRTWIDPLDQMAHHWIITRRNAIVASARMSFHDSLDGVPYSSLLPAAYWPRYAHKTIASINRLVVDPYFRGRGLAKLLDQARIDMAIDKGVEVLLAQPQRNRIRVLEQLGFSYVCELPPTPEMPERPLFFMELNLSD